MLIDLLSGGWTLFCYFQALNGKEEFLKDVEMLSLEKTETGFHAEIKDDQKTETETGLLKDDDLWTTSSYNLQADTP